MTKHYLNSKYQSEQRSSAMKKITMGTASIILGSCIHRRRQPTSQCGNRSYERN